MRTSTTITRKTLLRLLAAGCTAALSPIGFPAIARAKPEASPPPRKGPRTVTLITGDRVTLVDGPTGPVAAATAGPGRDGMVFTTEQRGSDVWVLPSDAASLVADSRLDERLFGVSALAKRSDQPAIPLIVQYDNGKAVPIRYNPKTASTFWKWLTGSPKRLPGLRSELGGAYGRNIRKVLLDVPARPVDSGPRAAAETHPFTLSVIDREGNQVQDYDGLSGSLYLVSLATGSADLPLQPVDGVFTGQFAPGAYMLQLVVLTPNVDPAASPSVTLVSLPRIDIAGPTTMRVDAREGRRATVGVEADGARVTTVGVAVSEEVAGLPWIKGASVSNASVEPEAYVVGTEAVDRQFVFRLAAQMQASNRTYELLFAESGRLPAEPAYSVADSELADLTVTLGAVRTVWTPAEFLHLSSVEVGTRSGGFGFWTVGSIPMTRRHLVSTTAAAAPITWTPILTAGRITDDWSYDDYGDPRQYEAGRPGRLDLSTAAFGPQGTGSHDSSGRIALDFAPVNSSAGGLIRVQGSPLWGEWVFTRNGTEIGRYSDAYFGYTENATGTATYTAVFHASRTIPWSDGYVPKVSGTWTFKSTQPASGTVPLPIISTRVTGPFDHWGRAPSGQAFPLTLHIDGARSGVVSASVALSYDDGLSWTTIPVSKATGQWVATVRHPVVTSGYKWVSLRVVVTDAQGNSGGWTATRSYRIAKLG